MRSLRSAQAGSRLQAWPVTAFANVDAAQRLQLQLQLQLQLHLHRCPLQTLNSLASTFVSPM